MSALDTIRTVIGRTISAFDQRKAQEKIDYKSLVREFALAPEKFDQEEIETRLSEYDIDPKQFGDDAELVVKRFRLKASSEKLPALAQKVSALARSIVEADQELTDAIQAAQSKHQKIIVPLKNQLAMAKSEVATADRDGNELTHTAPEEVRAEFAQATADLHEAEVALHSGESPKKARLDRMGRRLVEIRRWFSEHPHQPYGVVAIEQHKVRQKEFDDLKAEMTALEAMPDNDPLTGSLDQARQRLEAATAALSIV